MSARPRRASTAPDGTPTSREDWLQPSAIDGRPDLVLDLFNAEAGAHARSAVGLAELPFDIPVEIEGEVELVA